MELYGAMIAMGNRRLSKDELADLFKKLSTKQE
jgi:hypothetical protein